MFDIGFSELLLIGVVALLVIGPERLPKVARTAGHLFGRFQRYVADVKSDISREMELEELQKAGRAFKESVEQAAHGVEKGVEEAEYTMQDEVVNPIEEAAKAVAEPDPHKIREQQEPPQLEEAVEESNAETAGAPESKP